MTSAYPTSRAEPGRRRATAQLEGAADVLRYLPELLEEKRARLGLTDSQAAAQARVGVATYRRAVTVPTWRSGGDTMQLKNVQLLVEWLTR